MEILQTTLGFIRTCGTLNEQQVQAEIDQGADVTQVDDLGNTPLIHACFSLRTKTVALLLRRLSVEQVNHKNHDGSTALHFSVVRGLVAEPIITNLIEAGADMHLQNFYNVSAQEILSKLSVWKNHHAMRRLFKLEGLIPSPVTMSEKEPKEPGPAGEEKKRFCS